MSAEKHKSPLVSVYMATKNRPDMAKRAINSVLGQSYKNFELIVCDDGSEPDNFAQLKDWIDSQDSNIKLLSNGQSKGACAARNNAISEAIGEYITGLDDDDEFTPNRIEILLSHYQPEFAFVAASYKQITSSSQKDRTFDHGYSDFENLLHYNKIGNQVFTELRKVKEVGGFDENLPAMQDYDLWLRLSQKFGRTLKLPDILYILHNEHELERISSKSDRIIKSLSYVQGKYATWLSPAHLKTHQILEIRAKKLKLSPPLLLKLINTSNYRFALSYFLGQFRQSGKAN